MGSGRRVALAAAGLAGALGAYGAARLGWAEILGRRAELGAVERAIGLAEGNAEYHRWRAALLGAARRAPGEIEREVRRAAELNGRDASALVELGLGAEERGDAAGAEGLLLRAAGLDAGYDPRWALVNFYFRQQAGERFWKWAPEACRMSYGGRGALFRLYWAMSEEGGLILRRGIGKGEREAEREYLGWLLGTEHWRGAGEVAERLKPAGEAEVGVLVRYCERLLEAGEGAEARGRWNGLARAGLIPYQELDGAGRLVTNGEFRVEPRGAGFDWRLGRAEGVTYTRDRDGLRIRLSGEQPAACELLSEYVAFGEAGKYRLEYEYRTEIEEGAPGLEWTASGVKLGEAGEAREWSRGAAGIETREAGAVAAVGLRYRRPSGSVRLAGSVWLRRVALGSEGR